MEKHRPGLGLSDAQIGLHANRAKGPSGQWLYHSKSHPTEVAQKTNVIYLGPGAQSSDPSSLAFPTPVLALGWSVGQLSL